MWHKFLGRVNCQSNFFKVWLGIFVVLVLVVFLNLVLGGQSTPSLQQVLAQNQSQGLGGSGFITSILALSLLGLSLAKGYEIFARNKSLAGIVLTRDNCLVEALPKDNRETEGLRQGIKELRETIEQLEQGKEILQIQTLSLTEKLKVVTDKVKKVRRKKPVTSKKKK